MDFEGLRGLAFRKFQAVGDEWEDVGQTACEMALKYPTSTPLQLVNSAARQALYRGKYRQRGWDLPSELLLEVPSHYPTLEELMDRWEQEEAEEALLEWFQLTPAEKAQRRNWAELATWTSPTLMRGAIA